MKFKLSLMLKLLYCTLLFISYTITATCQSTEVKEAMDAISSITSSGSAGNTAKALRLTGFNVPKSLQASWNRFPAYRQIETAYWIAESNGNGDKFLALLSQNLAQEYESVWSERQLQRFLNIEVGTVINWVPDIAALTFRQPPIVPEEIRKTILSITEYTDAKALGGTTGVLKYYFDLPEDKVCEILRHSSTDIDALLTGINEASIPPSQKERLKAIITELRQNFESANNNAKFSTILEENELLVKEENGIKLKTKANTEKIKARYEEFINKTHPTFKSRRFKLMKINPEGFGGVVFGNTVKISANLGKLEKVFWIHNKDTANIMGTLKFSFADGSDKSLPGVLLEDAYAAYNIVYIDNPDSDFEDGEGIGLTGATYPDLYDEDKVYDSLIKSNQLTANELAYYRLRNNLKRSIDSLNKIREERMQFIRRPLKEIQAETDLKTDELRWKLYSSNKIAKESLIKKRITILKISMVDTLINDEIKLMNGYKKQKKYSLYENSGKRVLALKKVRIQLSIDSLSADKRFRKDSVLYTETIATLLDEEKKIFENDSIARGSLIIRYGSKIDSIYYGDSTKRHQLYNIFLEQKKGIDSNSIRNVNSYLSRTDKIILHPAIANLQLGRSLIRADVLPRTGSSITNKTGDLSKLQQQIFGDWLAGSDSIGWKFTDDSLLIDVERNVLKVSRASDTNNASSVMGVLNFNKIVTEKNVNNEDTTLSIHFIHFKTILPALIQNYYDYYRLNTFAKVLAVFRWMKQSIATFHNKPITPSLYVAPAYSVVTMDGKVKLIDMR